MSKRLLVTLASKIATIALVWHAIGQAAASPESSAAIAAICSTCVAVMIGGSWAYSACETKRPSGTTRE